ncbi:MAG: type IV pilin protein [Betaproteobacteria bacterium]|nr:type IV pilin protein [Rubrivivax sp.]
MTAVARRGFTLLELLVAMALAALLITLGLRSQQGQGLRSGRLDAVEALTRLQRAQEQHRSAHGLYASDLAALIGAAATSPQGRYAIALDRFGGEAYRATAIAQGAQARDTPCATLTLEVRQGFAQTGPDAGCWLR